MSKFLQLAACGIMLCSLHNSSACAASFYEEEVITSSPINQNDVITTPLIKVDSSQSFIQPSQPSEYPEYSGYSSETIAQPLNSDNCPSPVGLVWDEHLSPHVGAELLMTANRCYQLLDDYLIPRSAGDTSNTSRLGRFGKLVAEDILGSWAVVAQHEVFGHGYRLREFHVSTSAYKIRPYSGNTRFNATKYARLPSTERIAITLGGIEGEQILANRVRNRWLTLQNIDSRESPVYEDATLRQTFYVLDSHNHGFYFAKNHDIEEYIQQINQWYGSQVLTATKLKKRILVDFLDPFIYFSLYTRIMYVIEGCQNFHFPMIRISEYQYLPAFRLNLTPFGPEYQFNNYIKTPCRLIQANLRLGNTGSKQTWGIGIFATQIYCANALVVDGKLDIWKQPEINKFSALYANGKLGTAASLIARYRVLSQLDINAQVGYKTSGYLPGEILPRGVIFRIGFGTYI